MRPTFPPRGEITTPLLVPARDARQTQLAVEARRLAHRRLWVEAATAKRCQARARDLPLGFARARTQRRVLAIRLRFHRTIDALVEAGGFDEALTLLRLVRVGRLGGRDVG